ncbi:MAG TPA: hypothetical protein VND54_11945 [Candidatus Saccharimonadales bacterium]|nr:hypothetical protein [Candidatus Saccharimonadales bacterium]
MSPNWRGYEAFPNDGVRVESLDLRPKSDQASIRLQPLRLDAAVDHRPPGMRGDDGTKGGCKLLETLLLRVACRLHERR